MIRHATLQDRFAVLRMQREFVDSLGLLPFDAPYAERMTKEYILSPDRLCLVHVPKETPQGFLMAHCAPHPFWPVMVAQELAWWVTPAYRGRGALKLLDAYEQWAKEKGCALVGMAHLGDERLTHLYERRGYQKIETSFLTRLI